MKSSLYTCIQDIQNGDREQALALLEKFSPLLKKYAFFLQSEDALPDFQCFLLSFAKNLQLNELIISTDSGLHICHYWSYRFHSSDCTEKPFNILLFFFICSSSGTCLNVH